MAALVASARALVGLSTTENAGAAIIKSRHFAVSVLAACSLLLGSPADSFAAQYSLTNYGPELLNTCTSCSSKHIEFNVADALPGGGGYVLPYDIAWATYSFSFSDNGDTLVDFGYESTTPYQFVSEYYSGDILYRDYLRDATALHLNPVEAVALLVNGAAAPGANGVTPPIDSLTSLGTSLDFNLPFTYFVNVSGIIIPLIGVGNYYSNNYQHLIGNTGDLSINLALSASDLQTLSQTGKVSFDIYVVNSIVFNEATLTFEIAPNSESIPEPATLALLGLGLAGLAVTRRRKQ